MYGGMDVWIHIFLTSALDGGMNGRNDTLAALPLGRKPPVAIV